MRAAAPGGGQAEGHRDQEQAVVDHRHEHRAERDRQGLRHRLRQREPGEHAALQLPAGVRRWMSVMLATTRTGREAPKAAIPRLTTRSDEDVTSNEPTAHRNAPAPTARISPRRLIVRADTMPPQIAPMPWMLAGTPTKLGAAPGPRRRRRR